MKLPKKKNETVLFATVRKYDYCFKKAFPENLEAVFLVGIL